jgi:hypothetical protein
MFNFRFNDKQKQKCKNGEVKSTIPWDSIYHSWNNEWIWHGHDHVCYDLHSYVWMSTKTKLIKKNVKIWKWIIEKVMKNEDLSLTMIELKKFQVCYLLRWFAARVLQNLSNCDEIWFCFFYILMGLKPKS